MVAAASGGAAVEHDLVYGYVFFQCAVNIGDQGGGVEVWWGAPLQGDTALFYGDYYRRGGLLGRVDCCGLFHRDVRDASDAAGVLLMFFTAEKTEDLK